MIKWIKDALIKISGIKPTLVKIVESASAAIRVIDHIKEELSRTKVKEKIYPSLDVVREWLETVVVVLNKVLSIKIDDETIFQSRYYVSSNPIEELKRQIDSLKGI